MIQSVIKKTSPSAVNTFFIVSCLIVVLSILFAGPVWDIDFWYHLTNGKYILANKTLPETDIFSYASEYTQEQHVLLDSSVTLKGYWLAQIIFFMAFKLAGFYGIIMLRAFLLVSTSLLIYIWAKKNQCNDFIVLSLIILAALSSASATGERPQLFSFFFAPLTVFLLEQFKENNIKGTNSLLISFLLPVIMLVWANCHRGFILGTAILILFWGTESIAALLKKDKTFFMRLTLTVAIAVAASFINPNTYKVYLFALELQSSALPNMISEYLSPFAVSKYGVAIWPYWTYLVITLLTFLLHYKKIDITSTAITLFLAILSLSTFRYIPFFIYITIPFTARQLTSLIRERAKVNMLVNRIGVPLLILVMGYLFVSGYKNNLNNTFNHPIEKYKFPEKAVPFIMRHSPKGNIFNHFSWGGYLMWELYPEYKVFVDSRTLNLQALSDYTYMLWDSSRAQQLFDRYKINIIIMPGIAPFSGELYAIVNYLVQDKQWHLIYTDETSLIFIRGSENAGLIKSFSMSKIEAYTQVIIQATHMLNSGVRSAHIQQAIDTAYKIKGLYKNQ